MQDREHVKSVVLKAQRRIESESPGQSSKDEPFFVEVDVNGCERCGHGKQWTVVGPDGVQIGQSFEDEELASEIAEYMNQGYRAGCSGE
jgi:hypothetical protein